VVIQHIAVQCLSDAKAVLEVCAPFILRIYSFDDFDVAVSNRAFLENDAKKSGIRPMCLEM
jgi:hypothetical protein